MNSGSDTHWSITIDTIQTERGKEPQMKKLMSSMKLNIIGTVVALLLVFGILACSVGLVSFTRAFKGEYATATFHMASTAAMFVNGDHLSAYLDGEYSEEYAEMHDLLQDYTQRMHVSLIYVIQVDQRDYGRFVSIVNLVDNTVDNSGYTEWELGHKRDTTNDEYRRKYKMMYELEAEYETVYRDDPTDGQHPHITTMVPVKASSGEVTGILCMQRPISELNAARRPFWITIAAYTILTAVLASCWFAYFIKKHFITPVTLVSDEATRFARENQKGRSLGKVSRFKEIENLAESIETMETDMLTYMDTLTTATAERERIGTELSLASTIQQNSIPQVFPPFPDRTEFDIYASMTPAREVGGDFYNFYFIDDDHLAMVIGDVSGKGIPAALFMMITNILVSDRTQMGGSPAEILSFVNQNLCEHNSADMFVTLWLGILELSTGILTAANAGHEYPALKPAGGEFEILKDKHGLAAAAMEGIRYRDYEIRLAPGAKIFVYSDGVPEAADEGYRMFGLERMIDALNEEPEAAPETILNNVRSAVDRFVRGAEQFDDLTMLCIEYRGKGEK